MRELRRFVDLPVKQRLKAARRLAAVQTVGCYERTGLTRCAAVAVAATDFGVGYRTIWTWLQFVSPPLVSDYDLACLAGPDVAA